MHEKTSGILINALAFKKHLEANLFALASEIIERRYTPKPSICCIVDKPVKREIFAADFPDRFRIDLNKTQRMTISDLHNNSLF